VQQLQGCKSTRNKLETKQAGTSHRRLGQKEENHQTKQLVNYARSASKLTAFTKLTSFDYFCPKTQTNPCTRSPSLSILLCREHRALHMAVPALTPRSLSPRAAERPLRTAAPCRAAAAWPWPSSSRRPDDAAPSPPLCRCQPGKPCSSDGQDSPASSAEDTSAATLLLKHGHATAVPLQPLSRTPLGQAEICPSRSSSSSSALSVYLLIICGFFWPSLP